MIEQNEQIASESEEVRVLKAELQEQRRMATLLRADLHAASEASENIRAELREARAEVAAHRLHRKELMGTIADLEEQLRERFQELALLERRLIRTNYVWRVKGLIAKFGRRFRSA